MTNTAGLILVGGFGTRLRPLTLTQPKPLLPLLNRPFLAYQFDQLQEAGIRTVVLAASKQFRPLEKNIRRLAPRSLTIIFAFEPEPLGTGGAIRFGYDTLRKNTRRSWSQIAAFNGDVLSQIDVRKFVEFHRENTSDCSIALTKVEDPSRFGVVETSADHRVRKFIEKPQNYGRSAYINAGAYVLSQLAVETISQRKAVSIERDIFPELVKNGKRVFGFKLTGYWNDIGTAETYLSAHLDLLKGNNWTGTHNFRKRSRLSRSNNRFASPQAQVLVGSAARIAKGITFRGAVCIGEKVIVGSASIIQDSVILAGTHIGASTQVQGAIIGRNCRIGNNCLVRPGAVIGDHSVITDFTKV